MRGLPEHACVLVPKARVTCEDLGDVIRIGPHLARIENWQEAMGPQAVTAPVPAEPTIEANIQNSRSVAVDRCDAHAQWPAVRPARLRLVARGTRDGSSLGEPALEEQRSAQRDGRGGAGHAIARIPRGLRRPGPVKHDGRDLGFVEDQLGGSGVGQA